MAVASEKMMTSPVASFTPTFCAKVFPRRSGILTSRTRLSGKAFTISSVRSVEQSERTKQFKFCLEDIPAPASAGSCARWLLLRYTRRSGQKFAECNLPQDEDGAQTDQSRTESMDNRHRHKTTRMAASQNAILAPLATPAPNWLIKIATIALPTECRLTSAFVFSDCPT